MNELIFIVEEDLDGGYSANALGVSIFTQGDTIEELKTNIKDALKCHFDSEAEIPKIIRLHQVKEEVFAYV
jgi:predicted RNase H-like HicB family nuclease